MRASSILFSGAGAGMEFGSAAGAGERAALRHVAEQLHGHGERPARGVPADQRHIVGARELR